MEPSQTALIDCDFDDDGGDYEEEESEKEKDDVFHLIDGIFEGADSSGHVVRDDPVKGAGEEGDDEGEDGNVEDNLIILCKGGDGQ